jgi:branched-chain amino acid transport system ATP-binding protein
MSEDPGTLPAPPAGQPPVAAGPGHGPGPEVVLEVEDLSAGYDAIPVVRGLSMTVHAGEVVALMGANGAGKTTTLRAISGLVRVMSGRISFGGSDLAGVSATARARSGIAHVPEGRGIFFGLTVAEHFRVGMRPSRADLDAALAHFPALRPLLGRRAGLLSGGEQQMLAIACALIQKPRLLLLDELSLGLAPVIVERLLPAVRAFADAGGAGVVLVEQHVRLGLEIADRAYVLAHGDLTTSGSADELRKDTDRLVASYLGETEPSQ